eukprot:6374500-Amphidinium_carterae.1
MSTEAPPVHGEDAVEIEGVGADSYSALQQQRQADRKAREVAEDNKDEAKPKFIQPHKEISSKKTCKCIALRQSYSGLWINLFTGAVGDSTVSCDASVPWVRQEKRFKIYMKYEGRKGPPAWIKVRLPKHGGFEDGPAIALKKMFCNFYNRIREMISVHSVHLRSDTGIAIPDEDAISGYVGYGGLIHVADGSAPGKLPEWQVWFWGANSWSDPKGDTPSNVLTLQRKRICQVSVGKEHAMALTEGGRVFAWGKNDFGQLGTGDEETRALPVYTELPYETYISQIAAGGNFTVGMTKRGEVWSWGRYQASNFPRLFTDT